MNQLLHINYSPSEFILGKHTRTHKAARLPHLPFLFLVLLSHPRYPQRKTSVNMSDLDSKSYGGAPKAEGAISQVEHAANLDEKAHISDFKADAMEAEEAEHKMGVIEAVKAYPMASFWAFVMSFTIVSPVLLLPKISQLIPCLDYGILRCLPHR
jgi:hypothetical protein